MRRNKEQTKHSLVNAVGTVLSESGFSGLGVNAVAKAAGVDKVLIYRYFGSFDALCLAFAQSSDFWPSIEELIPNKQEFLTLDLDQRLVLVFKSFSLAIRSRPLALEVMAWELMERNAFTQELESVREEFGMQLGQFITDGLPSDSQAGKDIDWFAVSTIFSAATQYLALRARTITTYNGVDIGSDNGWQRLEAIMEQMISGLIQTKTN